MHGRDRSADAARYGMKESGTRTATSTLASSAPVASFSSVAEKSAGRILVLANVNGRTDDSAAKSTGGISEQQLANVTRAALQNLATKSAPSNASSPSPGPWPSLYQNSADRGMLKSRIYIAVLTTTKSVARREAIRKTWKGETDRHPRAFLVEFVICRDGVEEAALEGMESEKAEYQDIVVLNCTEGYRGGYLTRKVLAAMEHFEGENADGSMTTFMKADDDALLRVEGILEMVERVSATAANYYIGCLLAGGGEPDRNPNAKWYEPEEVFQGTYPVAASGAGYILNAELVHRFLHEHAAEVEKLMLWNEDKAVGLWVKNEVDEHQLSVSIDNLPGEPLIGVSRHRLQARLAREPGFDAWKDLLLFHKLEPAQMVCIWEALHNATGNETTRNDRVAACAE